MLRPICFLVLVASVLSSPAVSAQDNNAALEIVDLEQQRKTSIAYECVLYDAFMDSVLRAMGFGGLHDRAVELLGAPGKIRRQQFKAFKDQLRKNVNDPPHGFAEFEFTFLRQQLGRPYKEFNFEQVAAQIASAFDIYNNRVKTFGILLGLSHKSLKEKYPDVPDTVDQLCQGAPSSPTSN